MFYEDSILSSPQANSQRAEVCSGNLAPPAGCRRFGPSFGSWMKGKGQCKCKSSLIFPHYKFSYCSGGCSLLNLTLAAECHTKLQPTVTTPFSECSLCSWSNLELLISYLLCARFVFFCLVSSATPAIISFVSIKFSTYHLYLDKHSPKRGL